MSAPRILGGSARGRRLQTAGKGTRPTPSRLREALFDILAFEPRGTFLDLYSGTGAVGLEAASRGWRATCVESDPVSAAVVRANARTLDLTVTVHRGDALAFARRLPSPFDVTFADPPYDTDLSAIFAALLVLRPREGAGILAFQHPTTLDLAAVPGRPAGAAETRRYGSNSLTLVR